MNDGYRPRDDFARSIEECYRAIRERKAAGGPGWESKVGLPEIAQDSVLEIGLSMPGTLSRTAWQLPKRLSLQDWIDCGRCLAKIEGAVQWWLGDWWAYGSDREWGKGAEFAETIGLDYGTLRNYGSVARAVELSLRNDKLTFDHHRHVAPLEPAQQRKWLALAQRENWSSNELKTALAREAAIAKTTAVDLEAQQLGRFAVLYADPPWRYEHPPMGGSNRSIENHYPTMLLEEICALPVRDIAHDDSVLFMWATNPKLYECMKVLDSWGFEYRTDMVWIKDRIGMGYYVREKHETLLIARRGDFPVPTTDARPDSVVAAPRLEHSAKPVVFYDHIDRMYPAAHKVELFCRGTLDRPLWTVWGNQAGTRP